MLKRGLLLISLFMAIYGVSSAQGRRVIVDKVVAIVGSSSILHSEVVSYARQIEQQRLSEGYTSDRDPFSEALEMMMEQKLLYNQGQIDSVFVSSIDIEMRAEEQVQQMVSMAGGIAELEQQQNLALYNIKENIRRRLEEQAYAQSMQMDVISSVSVVPGDVDQFYKRKDKGELPVIGEQYVYAQITKHPSSIDEAKLRVRERLLDMRERIISGSTRFDALARMYSVDGSAYRGGELEPQPLHSFVAPFADALAALQDNQVSEIVETEYGFHIIEKLGQQGDMYHARHILLRPVFTDFELDEPSQFLDSLVGRIRLGDITFAQAAQQHSDDAHSKMNGGIVSNHDLLEMYNAYDAKLTVTRFLKEDFGKRGYKSIDDFMALQKLKIGEISPAFSTEDLSGNKLSKVVQLVNVIPAHTASLSEDYLRLEEMALQEKQQSEYKKWLDAHIEGMYIYISEEYRNADFENKKWVK